MRAFLRTSRRTGVSMPFWLAIPFMLGWATLMLLYVILLAAVFLAQSAWLGGRWCWVRWRQSHPRSAD